MTSSARDIIAALDLKPHPEGGHYRQTWKADAAAGERAAGTAIYFLLAEGEVSHWHRVDSAEIWHFYRGAPLELSLSPDGRGRSRSISLAPILTPAKRRRSSCRAMSGKRQNR